MALTITNRIVTRGMGPARGRAGRAGLVTQGYGGPFGEAVAESAQRAIRRGRLGDSRPGGTRCGKRSARSARGRSGDRRYLDELEEIIVWAKLIEVNNMPPKKKVEGFVRVKVDPDTRIAVRAEGILGRVRNVVDRIKVTIKRLK